MKNSLQEYRVTLDKILDQLIPANVEKGIPSAGSIGVSEFIEKRASEDEAVLNAMHALLVNAEKMKKDIDTETVMALEADNPRDFVSLLNLTYMGYYSRPEIRSVVGVGGWPVHPKGYEVPLEPPDMMDKLTAPVRSRGPMYRDSVNAGSESSR